jgi:predicted nuclease with TOPRIM domain
MAMPALKFELETPLEERVGRLEANVEHIRIDVSDIKNDIRRLNDKIEKVDQRLSDKIDGVKDAVTALTAKMEKARHFDLMGWFLMAASILGVMAKGFKWI